MWHKSLSLSLVISEWTKYLKPEGWIEKGNHWWRKSTKLFFYFVPSFQAHCRWINAYSILALSVNLSIHRHHKKTLNILKSLYTLHNSTGIDKYLQLSLSVRTKVLSPENLQHSSLLRTFCKFKSITSELLVSLKQSQEKQDLDFTCKY